MANQSARKKNRKSAWQHTRPMGSLPALIVLVGAAAMLLTWLLQSIPIFTRKVGADVAAVGLRT